MSKTHKTQTVAKNYIAEVSASFDVIIIEPRFAVLLVRSSVLVFGLSRAAKPIRIMEIETGNFISQFTGTLVLKF